MDGQRTAEGLPPVAAQFLAYKRTIQGCSSLTIAEYAADLRTFFRFIKKYRKLPETAGKEFADIPVGDVDAAFAGSVTTAEIYEFLFYVGEKRDNLPATRARKLSTVKSFYKYLTVKANLVEDNPAKNIDTPRLRRAVPKFLSLEESKELLSAVGNDAGNPHRRRDYAIITLFLNCGMRLSELVGISIRDIDRGMESIRILGKNNKERFVYLNDASKRALADYLIERSEAKKIDDPDALFLSRLGVRINKSTIQKMVEKYLMVAGLGDRRYSTHKLRHTSATLMYRYGGTDVKVLQEILGHENLNTTQIYTHAASGQIRAAVDANPLAAVRIDENKEDKDA